MGIFAGGLVRLAYRLKMAKLYKRKKDTGIIPELGITEEMRDRLRKRDWSGPLKNRPIHADNWTTKECEEKKFSGIRVNRLNGMTEIWIRGQMRVHGKTTYVAKNPGHIATMMEIATESAGHLVEIEVVDGRLSAKGIIKAMRH